MKQLTLTVIRNAKRVGKNSVSYDAKHPENPIHLAPLRPELRALKTAKQYADFSGFKLDARNFAKQICQLNALSNLPRMEIRRGVVTRTGGAI
jgi:hypothetical protein